MAKIIIYSSVLIAGLEGAYKNPDFFEKPEKDAELVYTDKETIKKAYEALGVKVENLGGADDNTIDKLSLAKEFISSITDKVDEALENLDIEKINTKKDGTLDKKSLDYINEVVENLGGADE